MKKLFIIFAILCLAAPAMAADWNFYGSSRFATFYGIVDKDIEGDNDTINRTTWNQQGNSRIGANVKVNDQISGSFEMSSSFGKRKLFGKYTFGGGSEFLIGQTYTPTSKYFLSNSVYATDGDLLNVGQFYAGRREMVQWKTGGFAVAFVNPTTPADVPGTYFVDLIIPKIELAYNMKGDAFFFDVFGGYQTYGLDYTTGTDPDVQSWVAGANFGMNFGAFYFKLGGHANQNPGEYGASSANLFGVSDTGLAGINNSGQVNPVNQEYIDNTGWGALLVLGMNVSDAWTIEAGGGTQVQDLDVEGESEESVWQAYINATINIVPGFFVVPEIGYASYDYAAAAGAKDPNPNVLYVGAKWQINF